MKWLFPRLVAVTLVSAAVPVASVWAAEKDQAFEVTVTDLTRGQQFTPIIVAR